MKTLLIAIIAMVSTTAFAREYVYFQIGTIENQVVSIFSTCSSDINQFSKWHKQLDKLNLFDSPTAGDSIVFESAEDCVDFVSDAIENKQAISMSQISVKGKTRGNKILHKNVTTLKIEGSIRY